MEVENEREIEVDWNGVHWYGPVLLAYLAYSDALGITIMPNQDVAQLMQIRFRKIIALVEERLEYIGLKKESEIWVTDFYQNGWEAVVGAEERLWVFTCHNTRNEDIKLSVEPCNGCWPSGAFIRDVERRI